MKWLGDELKRLVSESGHTQATFSRELGVSRQTYVDWTGGQVPKGHHLLGICKLLGVEPSSFFQDEEPPVVVPLHRRRRNAKVTPQMNKAAKTLAAEYVELLTAADMPAIRLQIASNDLSGVPRLALALRARAGLADSDRPVDYRHAFALLEALGVCVIFRRFPPDIKGYAFYTSINDQRAVFVNTNTNVLDLIFPVLHEATHAVRGAAAAAGYGEDEETFSDAVASAVQFPPHYVDLVHEAVNGRAPGVIVNALKTFARRNHHVVYGIVSAIEHRHGTLGLSAPGVHGADAKLRQETPTLGDELFSRGPGGYVSLLKQLSPIYFDVVRSHWSEISVRRLGELLDLGGVLDAQLVRREFEREAAAYARDL